MKEGKKLAKVKKAPRSPMAKGEIGAAYAFLAPSLITFLCLSVAPLFMIVYLSFHKYNIITPAIWNNYANWKVLTLDKRFISTLLTSLKFVALLVPMHMIMGLALAFAVNAIKNKVAVYCFRTIYYFPTLLATSSIAMAWTMVLNKDFGLLNWVLGQFGVEPIAWLNSSFWGFPATMIFSLWKFVGGYFLYFFIGLQGVDKSLLEAADIDGANSWQKTRHITLPMISPTIFFVLITMMIGTIQIFDEPYMLTGGGPGDATRTISLYIYNTAFQSQKYGQAASQSIVLAIIIMIITLIQFKGSKWVNYDR